MLKPLSDAIGTAAGVAWPSFGILSAVLALTMGSGTALIFGSIAIGVFACVAIPMVWWSYKSIADQNKENDEKLARVKTKTHEFLLNFISVNLKSYILKNSISQYSDLDANKIIHYLNKQINKNDELRQKHFPEYFFLYADFHYNRKILRKFIKKLQKTEYTYEHLSESPDYPVLFQDLESRVKSQCQKLKVLKYEYDPYVFSSPTSPVIIKTAAMNFFAAFGAIAGGTAGASGVLVGLGVITSLTSVPIIGWLGLTGAIIFGVALASLQIYSLYEENKKKAIIKYYKHNNLYLEKKVHDRKIKLDVKLKQVEKNKLAEQSNKAESSNIPIPDMFVRKSDSFSTLSDSLPSRSPESLSGEISETETNTLLESPGA